MGYTISRVTYTYKVLDLPDWAKSKDVIDGVGDELQKDVNSDKEAIKIVVYLCLQIKAGSTKDYLIKIINSFNILSSDILNYKVLDDVF